MCRNIRFTKCKVCVKLFKLQIYDSFTLALHRSKAVFHAVITHESPETLLCFPLGSSYYTLFSEKGTEPEKRREGQRFLPPLKLTKEQ